MKTLLIRTIAIFAIFAICQTTYSQTNFQDLAFREAIIKAEKNDKFLFVDAYTDWCGWCKVMDRETFSNEAVGNFMNDKFVSIKVDMEEGFGIDLAMKYRVSSYPHYLMFDGSGQLLAKFGGFLEPMPFMEKINEVLLPANRLPELENPMDFDLGFPDFFRNSFKKRKDKSYPSPEELQAYLDAHPEVTDPVTWSIVYRFVNDGPYIENIIANKDKLVEKYGKDDVQDKLSRIVFAEVKAAIKAKSDADFQAALNSADALLGNDAEDYKQSYKLYYYQMKSDWTSYAGIGHSLAMEGVEENAPMLNQIAWTLYEKETGTTAVHLAESWMKDVIEAKPEYAYMDTYAAILFKLGKKEEALEAANRAIEIAEKTGEDHKGTTELLEKINAL